MGEASLEKDKDATKTIARVTCCGYSIGSYRQTTSKCFLGDRLH